MKRDLLQELEILAEMAENDDDDDAAMVIRAAKEEICKLRRNTALIPPVLEKALRPEDLN